ncbi:MAG: translation initiation factor [Myxococcales bacterium]|nr:translation initiation factor [Myxococcales bacterium]
MGDEKKPFHNPFAALQGLKDALPPGPPPKAPKEKEKKAPPKAVVRMERAGRNGKEVTVIEQLALSPKDRETWLKLLKGALGCGGTIEDEGALVIQGDHRERVAEWLKKQGVKQISVG